MPIYKLYKNKSDSTCLESSSIETLNTKTIHKWKLLMNKTLCVSFFCSLFFNALPANSLESLAGNSTTFNSSNVLFDKDGNQITESVDNVALESQIGIENSKNTINQGNQSNIIEKEEFVKKTYEFLTKESLSIDSLSILLDSMVSINGPFGQLYPDNKSALQALLKEEKSYKEKFLIVLARDGYTYDQLDYMCAGIAGETAMGGHCYDDAYAVASTLINRSHCKWYVDQYGHNFYTIFKAPGQYEIEVSGNYLKFLGAIDVEGYKAAIDAFYTRESIHSWIQFRANWVELNCKYETFAERGNKFIDAMEPQEYVPYPEEEVNFGNVKVFLYHKIVG